MALTFREASKAEDGDAVWSMLEPVFRSGDTYAVDPDISRADALEYWFSADRVYLEEDTGHLGTFYIRTNQRGGGRHVCNCGYVTGPGSQGKGVARQMLEFSLGAAKAMGFTAMQFNFVLETNERAVAIWKKAGFNVIGRQPRAFQHPDGTFCDALVMHKFL